MSNHPRIEDKPFQIFAYGEYKRPSLSLLTNTQLKVYNMIHAGFSIEGTADKIGVKNQVVRSHIDLIRSRGIEI